MNLFISTATDKVYLALFENNNILKEIIHQGNNDHTTSFYPLLDDLKFKFEDINGIYIVNGPGSYTGLRVGVIYAKMLGIEKHIDLYPIHLLEALYYSNDLNKVCVDAKGKKYYTYDGINHDLKPVDEIDESYLVDPLINIEKLINSDLFYKLEKVEPEKMGVNYVKSAL